MTPLEEPSNGSSMGFIPSVKLLLLAQAFTLINICVALEAQSGNPVVVGLESHSFAIALLVGMSGYHRAILRTADLTG